MTTPLSPVCTESGKMFSFGCNKYGELGLSHGGPQTTSTPTLVESVKDSVVRVACGRLHSAAIDGGYSTHAHTRTLTLRNRWWIQEYGKGGFVQKLARKVHAILHD